MSLAGVMGGRTVVAKLLTLFGRTNEIQRNVIAAQLVARGGI